MNNSNKATNTIELLAPAGSYDCFLAAINAGADAVYLGMSKFGARANAKNFSQEELINALFIAHALGRKIYLTVNTLFKESELFELYDFLKDVYKAGLDGVIVQDLGVVAFIKKYFPLLEVHASTQMAITDSAGVRFVQDLGISRVVPARELSLKEIKRIHDETGMEIECFVHGALCYSYSGKCLFSSCIGERSGNRGLCAGPCRLKYDDEYLLSMKDLCTLRIIPNLIEAGIYSFKIEGRMKNADYVYGVTSIYRKYIDEYLNNGYVSIDKNDEKQLLSLYTREGNCEGYYNQKNGRNMITIKSPSYMSKNDGDSNNAIYNIPKIKINIDAIIELNKKPLLKIYISDKRYDFIEDSTCVEGENIVAAAINAPVSIEQVKKQLTKLGDTIFAVDNIKVAMDTDIFVSNGELNKLRRAAISLLENKINECHVRNESFINDFDLRKNHVETNTENMEIKVSILDESQLDKAIEFDCVTGVILNYSLANRLMAKDNAEIFYKLVNSDKDIYIRLPYIIRNETKSISVSKLESFICEFNNHLLNNYNKNVKGYYVSSLELAQFFKEKNIDGEIMGDIHLYAYNHLAREVLLKNGITNTTVPFECSKGEIYARDIKGEELIVYGRIPMLVSTQCVYSTKNKCKYNVKGNSSYIKDRKGENIYCYSDCITCTNTIYNSVPLSITDERDYINKINPKSLRLDFTDESINDVDMILTKLSHIVDSGYNDFVKVSDSYTKGHLKKGVI